MDWKDITLEQFQKIQKLNLNDIEDQITATEVILGINADDLTMQEYAKEVKKLDFMNREIPKTIIRFSYDLNGRHYTCKPRLDELTVSQYMDFTNLAPTKQLEKILGVFLIPEGKKYGEYDIEEVYKDILTMSVVDAYAVFHFFLMQLQTCTKALEGYSMKMLKGKKNRDIRKAISAVMESYSMSDQ